MQYSGALSLMRYAKYGIYLILALSFLYVGLFFAADQFHPLHIKTKEKFASDDVAAPPCDIFNTSFHYLSKGSQCYCFQSTCGRYVLKLFRCNRYRVPDFLTPSGIPSFLQEIYSQKKVIKKQKWEALMQSCHLAQSLQKECALCYMHLAPTKELPSIILYDKLHRKYLIDPNNLPFIVQHKGRTLDATLQECPLIELQQILAQVAKLLDKRFCLGIGDTDPVIGKNMGIWNGQPFFLDIGTFYLDSKLSNPDLYQPEVERIIYNYYSHLSCVRN